MTDDDKKTQALEALNKIAATADGDPEGAHVDADGILLTYIDDPDIAAAWHAVTPKWFA